MKIGLIAIGIAIVLGIATIVIRRLKAAAMERAIETRDVDILTFKDVISFFKQPDVLERLMSSPDLIAVAIKETQENAGVKVILCAFNKRDDKVEFPFVQYKANSLDMELISVFGEKDMIVLK